jgi:hypothetical protein
MSQVKRRKEMRKENFLIFSILIFLGLAMPGCDDRGYTPSSPTPPPDDAFSAKVSGVAVAGGPIVGFVLLKDSTGMQIGPKTIGKDGTFIFDVKGLKAPFYLCAEGMVGSTNYRLFSAAISTGIANITPLSSIAVALAAGVNDPAKLFDSPVTRPLDQAALDKAVADLMAMFKPMMDAYSAYGTDPIKDFYTGKGKRDLPD